VTAHDYGGAVSLRTHLSDPVGYASLCLVDVVALRPWGSPFFTLFKDDAGVFAQLPAAVHHGELEAYIASASDRGLCPGDMATLVKPWCDDNNQPRSTARSPRPMNGSPQSLNPCSAR
jgi:pimeloyl-ACP methyl ester carboxylesterase